MDSPEVRGRTPSQQARYLFDDVKDLRRIQVLRDVLLDDTTQIDLTGPVPYIHAINAHGEKISVDATTIPRPPRVNKTNKPPMPSPIRGEQPATHKVGRLRRLGRMIATRLPLQTDQDHMPPKTEKRRHTRRLGLAIGGLALAVATSSLFAGSFLKTEAEPSRGTSSHPPAVSIYQAPHTYIAENIIQQPTIDLQTQQLLTTPQFASMSEYLLTHENPTQTEFDQVVGFAWQVEQLSHAA